MCQKKQNYDRKQNYTMKHFNQSINNEINPAKLQHKKRGTRKLQEIRRMGMLISILLGLELEAVFYYVFGIQPVYVPIVAVIILWAVNSIMIGCVVDEFMKRKYKIRIYSM